MGRAGKTKGIGEELLEDLSGPFGTILADPPWRFQNRTGKMAPEHRRLRRYGTMSVQEIMALPVASLAAPRSHLYLWVPNTLLGWGLDDETTFLEKTRPQSGHQCSHIVKRIAQ